MNNRVESCEAPKLISVHILDLANEIKDLSDSVNQDSYDLKSYFQGGNYINESNNIPTCFSGFYQHIEEKLLEIRKNLVDIRINIKDVM